MKHLAILSLAILSLAALAPAAAAQEVRCLLAEGGPLPGAPGHTVTSISNTAVNQVGGYACTVNTSDGTTTISHVWGNAGLGPGAPLQTEATFGSLQQNSFESFFGFDDNGVASYSPICTDTSTGTTGIDGVWYGDAPVALEFDPIPSLPGKVWRFGSRPGVTRNGIPYWVGGINDAASGANEGNGLFFGFGATPIYKTGDQPPGVPAPITAVAGVDFDFRFSALGTHHITAVDADVASTEDGVVVMDGAALMISGGIVQEGKPVTAVGALPGENWQFFDFFGVNEAGDYFFTGDTGAATSMDEFILRNGVIVFREGDVVDGHTLTGAIEGAFMNESGEIAYIWDVEDPSGSLEALFFEDQLILLEGDTVDIDGDGVPEPGATISNFTGISSVTIGPNRVIHFTADVDTMGTSTTTDDVECFFAATVPGTPDFLASPATLSVSAGGTQAMFAMAGAALGGDVYWVLGSLSGTSPGIPFGAFTIPLNPDFYFFVTVNQPNTPPLEDTLGNLDADGRAVALWDLPPGVLPVLAGLTMDHAYIVLDQATLAAKHVSTTVELTFVP